MTRVEDYDVSKLVEFKGRTVPTAFDGGQVCQSATIGPVPLMGELWWKVQLYDANGHRLCSCSRNMPAAAIEGLLALIKPAPEPDEEPWVNVNDGLPLLEGVPCWTRDRANSIRLARIVIGGSSGSMLGSWWVGEGVGCPVDNGWITHWMLDRKPEGPVEA